ncbi:hypothetical protein N7527_005308 [Penicillium freii]|uniref:Uncharacterized protein n=1 Tax=Penicillium hordei TaxID=40994 RepID=A0AAD6GZQ9_9EURO|nr:hypothetical protein N7527_005308 [Penicillium freii]KAJ5598517.1 hypothetical protein N7537_008601 [Penicillium hordei]
MTSSQMGR